MGKSSLNLDFTTYHLVLLSSLLAINGTICYHLFGFKTIPVFLFVFISIFIHLILVYYFDFGKSTAELQNNGNRALKKLRLFGILVLIIYCFSLISIALMLWNARTDTSILSPWQKIDQKIFWLFIVHIFALLVIIIKKCRFSTILLTITFFAANAVVLTIYKLGFGFDFHIHNATMELIDTLGAVEPKPFYYIGHYAIIIALHKLFFLPIKLGNLLIVPIFASLCMLPIIVRYLQERQPKNATLTALIIILLPFGFFFNSTPQNLAYIFLIICIFAYDAYSKEDALPLSFLSAIASLSIQPIAGIPALFYVALRFFTDRSSRISVPIRASIYLGAASVLPLLFFFLNYRSGGQSDGSSSARETLAGVFSSFLPKLPEHTFLVQDSIYLIANNAPLLILLSIIFAGFLLYKKYTKSDIARLSANLGFASLIAFLLVDLLPFSFLAVSERDDYADRVLLISLIFFLPLLADLIFLLIERISRQEMLIRIIFTVTLALTLSSFIYLNYPRADAYANAHGYSMGKDDLEAAEWIEQDADAPYIALANQQTSVAALSLYGFDRYLDARDGQQIYYYPIPTGGPLYVYFLKMVNEKPSRATMLEAMDYAQVDTAYLAISRYWWAADKLIEEAKAEADAHQVIGENMIHVFRFDRQDLDQTR